MQHAIKCWPQFFKLVIDGLKPFEVRKDDRNYQTGDILLLCEYEPESEHYTGRSVICHVLFVLKGGQFGIEPGYCVIGLKIVNTWGCK